MSIYYEINEAAAKQARQMWSFREYVEGSKTAEYRKQVDDCYKLIDRLPQDLKEKGAMLADRYARRLAEWYNKQFRIEMMCPSVMISGASNFPVRKKEKQNAAQDRHYALLKEIEEIPNKITKLMNGADCIRSDDENAIEKLKEKIKRLEENQERFKQVNAYYRKHKTLKGFSDVSDDEALNLDKQIESSFYKVPYPPYVLQNNNANIRRLQKRLSNIEQLKRQAAESTGQETEFFKVVENPDLMRLQLFFEDKPEAEIRDILKKHGFKWSPKNSAWQRQLTQNARYAVKMVIKELNSLKNTDIC